MDFYAAISPCYWSVVKTGHFLVSAGTWFKNGKFIKKPVPVDVRIIVDSGGYKFREYPFTLQEYISWSKLFSPMWVACPDVVGDTAETLKLWGKSRHTGVVPVAQGQTVSEYMQSLEQYYKDGAVFAALGGIKKNWKVAKQVIELSPVPLHLFGAGLRELKTLDNFNNVLSADSANWTSRFGKDLERFREVKNRTGWTQAKVAVDYFLEEYKEKIKRVQNLL